MTIEVPHTDRELNVIFLTTLNQPPTDESWGISDLRVEFIQDEPTNITA